MRTSSWWGMLTFASVLACGGCSGGEEASANGAGGTALDAAVEDGSTLDGSSGSSGDGSTSKDVVTDALSDDQSGCIPTTEVCNGIDDDCNGLVDEGDNATLCPQGGQCSFGACRLGGEVGWTRTFSATEGSEAMGAFLTDGGHVVAVGNFSAKVDFGGGERESMFQWEDIFVLELDSTGEWVRDFVVACGGRESVRGAARAQDGSLVIVGQHSGACDFGGGNRVSKGWDGFVLSLDPSGAYLWDRTFGEEGDDHVRAVSVTQDGRIYVTGLFRGTVDFGKGPHTAKGDDIFVLELDGKTGSTIWDLALGGAGSDYGEGLSADTSGLYIVGVTGGEVDFGGGVREPTGGFVLRLDPQGGYVWDRTWHAHSVAGAAGRPEGVAVVGWFTDPIDFGGGERVTNGDADVFVVALDEAGNHEWDHTFGGPEREFPGVIATDAFGAVVSAAMFQGTATFDTEPKTSHGNSDTFLVRMDPDGAIAWDETFGSFSWDYAKGIRFEQGLVLMTGSLTAYVTLPAGTVTRKAAFIHLIRD